MVFNIGIYKQNVYDRRKGRFLKLYNDFLTNGIIRSIKHILMKSIFLYIIFIKSNDQFLAKIIEGHITEIDKVQTKFHGRKTGIGNK